MLRGLHHPRNLTIELHDEDDNDPLDEVSDYKYTTTANNKNNKHMNGGDGTGGFSLGDHDDDGKILTTFRADGVSIGRDYLRLEGTTVTRGELLPENLVLQEVLGQGAFSVVRRALWKRRASSIGTTEETTEVETTISVAVKTCRLLESKKHKRERDMLVKELRALCKLSNPALVHLHGACLSDDDNDDEKEGDGDAKNTVITIVLEYMDRGALDVYLQVIGGCRPLSSALTASVAYQILHGLAYLHDERMIHRDLKPGNVLLSSTGEVKLCDFGMAALQQQEEDISLTTTVLGTRKFMAPERLRAQAYGRSSDIWSFGLILLECATGEPPWKDVTSVVELLVTVEETDVQELVPPTTEAGLEEMIRMSLQQNPEKRIPAKLLLLSPWFRKIHCLVDRETAVKCTRENL